MEIKSIIKSGEALNVVIDGWKENAIDYIVSWLKKRRHNQINLQNYSNSIKPTIKDVSICRSEKVGVLYIDLIRDEEDYFMVEDGDENWHTSSELSHNDLVKILKIIKGVQKADDAAKDF